MSRAPRRRASVRLRDRARGLLVDADEAQVVVRDLLGRVVARERPVEESQAFGIEVDIWKIEGVDERSDAEMLSRQARTGEGREGVVCVLLGRGASDEKVDHWLRAAAPVEGFIGFAIGRSIWWDPLKGSLDGSMAREDAAQQIADNYLRFIRVYEEQESAVA